MKQFLKRLMATKTVTTRGVTLRVGDTIKPTLHRVDESPREEEVGVLEAIERFEGCTILRLRRRPRWKNTNIGIEGENWHRTFEVLEKNNDDE